MKKTLLTLMLSGLAFSAWSQTTINLTLSQTQPALLEAAAGNDVSITDIENTSLSASATGGTAPYSYKWAPTTGLSNSTVANPTASPKDTTTYSVTVTDKNKCTASAEVTINVSKHISSTGNAAAGKLSVYPNPVGSSFYINLLTQAATAEVSLYSLEGKQLWQRTIATDMLSATAFEAPAAPGMYLLKVTSGTTTFTECIVVER